MAKKQGAGRRLFWFCALCAALALSVWILRCAGSAWRQETQRSAQRQLITVWIYGDRLNASPWVRRQAAAWQKTREGEHIWIRTVTQADLALLEQDYAHAAPDLLLFMADAQLCPDWIAQLQPLCMAGYALVARTTENATAAPTGLFGITPSPLQTAAVTPVPKAYWPQQLAADDVLGAYLLQEMNAPKGARLLAADALKEAFLHTEEQGALLSTPVIRALQAQGVGMRLLCAAPGSDLVLYGAVLQGAQAQAEAVLEHFLSQEAQRALAESGLFSTQGVGLYGADRPVFQAVENALLTGWRAQALRWPQEKAQTVQLGQMLYTAK